jgi:thymidylate kinase
MEIEAEAFYQRVRAKYLELAKEDPDRIKVVNGNLSPDEIEIEIRKLVLPLLEGNVS